MHAYKERYKHVRKGPCQKFNDSEKKKPFSPGGVAPNMNRQEGLYKEYPLRAGDKCEDVPFIRDIELLMWSLYNPSIQA